MKAARIRLVVAGVLFFGWLCWLGYLAATKTNPVVLSRSQAMVATHFVLANVTVDPATGLPERKVIVVENLRPQGDPLPWEIEVRNIKEARIGGAESFQEEGPYLLMLTRTESGYELTPPPRAPGNDSPIRPRPWAYLWKAPGVQEQFERLVPRR